MKCVVNIDRTDVFPFHNIFLACDAFFVKGEFHHFYTCISFISFTADDENDLSKIYNVNVQVGTELNVF